MTSSAKCRPRNSAARLQTIELGLDRVDRLAPLRRPRHFRKAEIKQHGYSSNTHSAVLVEVKVDEDLGTLYVIGAVSAIAAGRILNLKTARSQILGAVVWGMGMALPRRKCHRPELRSHYESQFGGISRSSECGCTQYSNRLCCRAGCNRESNRSKKVGKIRIVGVAA